MNQILALNVEEGWVEVEAGVVKDQLNDYLRPHGFFFAPDLSTSNRATIGGMINTDASGQGSLVYGKTSDHVLGLHCVLANGLELSTSKLSRQLAEQKSDHVGVGEIYRQILTTCEQFAAEIDQVFPKLNRFLTGYDLAHVFSNAGHDVDIGRVITGSEGSLAFVTSARLSITPIAKAKRLLVIKYDSFDSALRHSPRLVAANATSVETVDSKVLNLAKNDIVWTTVADLITEVDGQTTDGINLVEYNAESDAELEARLATLYQILQEDIAANNGVIGYQQTDDREAINRLYAMRKKAVGLLGNSSGNAKPIAFVEDTAVPPEHLADFIAEFRALLDSYQLDYGMFGHVDAGVLHVRPALDLCDPEQEKLLRTLSDQVVKLTAKYGGLMWGEHGKGYRSEYGPAFFGETLFNELRKIKAVFDPYNKMNPGKICTPFNSDAKLVSVDDRKRGYFDRQIPTPVKQSFPSPLACNGNGLCFNYDLTSPMCPSSKVTRDRRHSPKGRAGLMREWLRLVEQQGVDLLALEKQIGRFNIRQLINKVGNSLSAKRHQDDFSHEVMTAMAGCLACKACASQCPINVDVPAFKARFVNLYYSRYLRPAKDHLVANIEKLSPLMARFPTFINGITQATWVKKAIKSLIGYVDTPALSVPTLAKLNRDAAFTEFNYEQLASLPHEEKSRYLLVVQDPFTSFYDAKVVNDFMLLARKLGFNPILLPYSANGKPQHVKGFMNRFKRTAQQTTERLNQAAKLELPLVGLDASTVLCFRDEYRQILGDDAINFHVLLSHEWLHAAIANSVIAPVLAKDAAKTYRLLAHCTEKTALPKSESHWQQIFQHFGLTLKIEKAGCCGMAGTYGHESENLANSTQLFAFSWQDKFAQESEALVTGYSCRSQVKRLAKTSSLHPVQALLRQLN